MQKSEKWHGIMIEDPTSGEMRRTYVWSHTWSLSMQGPKDTGMNVVPWLGCHSKNTLSIKDMQIVTLWIILAISGFKPSNKGILMMSMFVHVVSRQVIELFHFPSVGCLQYQLGSVFIWYPGWKLLQSGKSQGHGCCCLGSDPGRTVQGGTNWEDGALLYNPPELLSASALIISDFLKPFPPIL